MLYDQKFLVNSIFIEGLTIQQNKPSSDKQEKCLWLLKLIKIVGPKFANYLNEYWRTACLLIDITEGHKTPDNDFWNFENINKINK